MRQGLCNMHIGEFITMFPRVWILKLEFYMEITTTREGFLSKKSLIVAGIILVVSTALI